MMERPYYSGKPPVESPSAELMMANGKAVVDTLYKMWQNQQLCDLIIKLDRQEFRTHKVPFVMHSRLLYQDALSQVSKNEPICVAVSDTTGEAIETIIRFTYTGKLKISADNIDPIVSCAVQLNMHTALERCKSYLLDFSLDTALINITVAQKYRLGTIHRTLYNYICEHVMELFKRKVYLELEVDRVCRLLSTSNLNVSSELDVLNAALTWLEYQKQARSQYLVPIMDCVRLKNLTPEELVSSVETVAEVMENPHCKDMLYKALRHHALHATGSVLVKFMPAPEGRRFVPYTGKVDAVRREALPTVSQLEFKTSAPSISENKNQKQESASYNYEQFLPKEMVGGHDVRQVSSKAGATPPIAGGKRTFYQQQTPVANGGQAAPKQVDHSPFTTSYAPQSRTPAQAKSSQQDRVAGPAHPTVERLRNQNQVPSQKQNPKNIPPMRVQSSPPITRDIPRPRYEPSRPLHTAMVLAIGGLDITEGGERGGPSQYVQQYTPRANQWKTLAQLPDRRHHHAVAVINGDIYIIGGSVFDPEEPEDLVNPTNICHCYVASKDTWRQISPMQQKRVYLGVATCGGLIYALCGQDETSRMLDTTEYYNPRTDSWQFIPSLRFGRIGVATASHRGMVFAAGGYSDEFKQPVLRTVGCFDPARNRWISKKPLQVARWHADLVEVSCALYLVGGATRDASSPRVLSLPDVMLYHDAEDFWETITTLDRPRHDAGVAALGSKLFIVGGISSVNQSGLSSVECYDVESDAWLSDVTDMPYEACGLSCCSLQWKLDAYIPPPQN